MRNIGVKVYPTRWADGEVHCDKCGGIMCCGGYRTWFCPACDAE